MALLAAVYGHEACDAFFKLRSHIGNRPSRACQTTDFAGGYDEAEQSEGGIYFPLRFFMFFDIINKL